MEKKKVGNPQTIDEKPQLMFDFKVEPKQLKINKRIPVKFKPGDRYSPMITPSELVT